MFIESKSAPSWKTMPTDERSSNISFFAHGRDLVAEDEYASPVRADQSVCQLEQHAFAAAGGPQQQAGFAMLYLKRDVLQDIIPVKGDGDVVKDDGQLALFWLKAAGWGFLDGSGHG